MASGLVSEEDGYFLPAAVPKHVDGKTGALGGTSMGAVNAVPNHFFVCNTATSKPVLYPLRFSSKLHGTKVFVPPIWTPAALTATPPARSDSPDCPLHLLMRVNLAEAAAAPQRDEKSAPAPAPAATSIASDEKWDEKVRSCDLLPASTATAAVPAFVVAVDVLAATKTCTLCGEYRSAYQFAHRTEKQKNRFALMSSAANATPVKAAAPNGGGRQSSPERDWKSPAGSGADLDVKSPVSVSGSTSDGGGFFDAALTLCFPPPNSTGQPRSMALAASGKAKPAPAFGTPTKSDGKPSAIPDSRTSLISLPVDIIARVLAFTSIAHICACARVCKTFQSESTDAIREFDRADLKWCRGATQLTAAAKSLAARFTTTGTASGTSVATPQWAALSTLELSGTPIADGLSIFTRSFGQQLSTISIEHSTSLCDADIDACIARGIGKSLIRLSLIGCGKLSSKSLASIGRYCPSLRVLNASASMKMVDDPGLQAVLNGCAELESLTLAQCIHVTDESLLVAANKSSNLKHVNVDRCLKISDAGLRALSTSKSMRLESLNLSNCHRVRAEGLLQLISSPAMKHSLVSLSLVGVAAVSDAVIQCLVQNVAKTLHSLDLTGADRVTRTGLLLLAGRLTELTLLSVSKISSVNDEVLIALSGSCPKLKALAIQSCSKVTDAGLCSLGRGCNQLTTFDAAGVWAITESGFKAFVTGCRGLKWISVRLCNHLTQSSFHTLAVSCAELETLFLGSVADEAGTHQAIMTVRKLHPNCKIFL